MARRRLAGCVPVGEVTAWVAPWVVIGASVESAVASRPGGSVPVRTDVHSNERTPGRAGGQLYGRLRSRATRRSRDACTQRTVGVDRRPSWEWPLNTVRGRSTALGEQRPGAGEMVVLVRRGRERSLAVLVAALVAVGAAGCSGTSGTAAVSSDVVSAPPAPVGEVVLRVHGPAGETAWDLAALEALPQRGVTTWEPFLATETSFTGPSLVEVLAASGIDDGEIMVGALDDYIVDLEVEDLRDDDVVLATLHAGAAMAIADGGPIRVVFGPDSRVGANEDLWIWSVSWISGEGIERPAP